MPSPSASAASENVVVYCAGLRGGQCPCTSNIKRARCRRLDTCLIQCVSHAVVKCWSALARPSVGRGTGQRVQWSAKVTTMHGARRPTAGPLHRGRCVSYDIAISRYEMPRHID